MQILVQLLSIPKISGGFLEREVKRSVGNYVANINILNITSIPMKSWSIMIKNNLCDTVRQDRFTCPLFHLQDIKEKMNKNWIRLKPGKNLYANIQYAGVIKGLFHLICGQILDQIISLNM